MRGLITWVMAVVLVVASSLPVAAQETIGGSMSKSVEKCLSSGWLALVCGIGVNLISNCLWNPAECAERMPGVVCRVERLRWERQYQEWLEAGNSGPPAPFVCSVEE